ncbi:MAG: xanthine phosphoribosyltransferase [Clostridia bacterium]|nr:xanthine phosphoribosyltransferase [Clostridia bacterium]
METLRQKIMAEGVGIGSDIIKVDMFLNHRIDIKLLFSMGEAWAEEFRGEKPDVVLTVEASGIAMAVAAAHALGDLPVVFAKKSTTAVLSDETVQAAVYSFTHKTQNNIRIERKYLPEGSRVLIIDDFLADGQAVNGMMSLCEQQKAKVVGVGIAVEKGFQPGGKQLREAGIHVKSLAIVDRIEDGKIVLRPDDD